MLPLLSRTVIGVLTRETLTPILASGGGCWMAAPGCGVIGPEDDCAEREGADARNAAASPARNSREAGRRYIVWAKPPRTVYPIRRNFSDKRCWRARAFLEW